MTMTVTKLAIASALVLASSIARADVHHSPDDARQDVKAALAEGTYGFCTRPHAPLLPRQAALCPLAEELEGCDALANACRAETAPPSSSLFDQLVAFLGPAARVLLWLLVAAIVALVAIPVVRGILRARRGRASPRGAAEPNRATPLSAPTEPASTDADEALASADEHARRGELARALSLYLSATLAALGKRGVVRLARHRTNGEYVRACAEPTAKEALSEIVREVDRVEYGKAAPTDDAVRRVAARAASVVRAAAIVGVLLLAGCGLSGGGPDDPAGDDLPIDVLRRAGWTVGRLPSSLATLPIPSAGTPATVLVVDASRVMLEDEARAHVERWVENGGILVAFGAWPELGAEPAHATTGRDVDVAQVEAFDHAPWRVRDARVASQTAIEWKDAVAVATIGHSVYSAYKDRGRGRALVVAGDDLFTNVGVARPANAAALAALVAIAAEGAPAALEGDEPREVLVARAEDGIAPPSNPFAALARAGLGRGAWHALAACIVLFLAYGIRHARPRPARPPARRAFAEHVEATGAFYAATRRRSRAHVDAAHARYLELRRHPSRR
jgi:hypothetical protein